MDSKIDFSLQPPSIVIRNDDIVINGERIIGPFPEQKLFEIFGKPDRIFEGIQPAPYGHKNNHALIYDNYGIYWLRDHTSGDLTSVTAVFREGAICPSLPHAFFRGNVELPQYKLNIESDVRDFKSKFKGVLKPLVGGIWTGHIGRFHLFVQTISDLEPRSVKGSTNLLSVSVGLHKGVLKREISSTD